MGRKDSRETKKDGGGLGKDSSNRYREEQSFRICFRNRTNRTCWQAECRGWGKEIIKVTFGLCVRKAVGISVQRSGAVMGKKIKMGESRAQIRYLSLGTEWLKMTEYLWALTLPMFRRDASKGNRTDKWGGGKSMSMAPYTESSKIKVFSGDRVVSCVPTLLRRWARWICSDLQQSNFSALTWICALTWI